MLDLRLEESPMSPQLSCFVTVAPRHLPIVADDDEHENEDDLLNLGILA
jgi:hypothetical protein